MVKNFIILPFQKIQGSLVSYITHIKYKQPNHEIVNVLIGEQ